MGLLYNKTRIWENDKLEMLGYKCLDIHESMLLTVSVSNSEERSEQKMGNCVLIMEGWFLNREARWSLGQ